VSIALGEKATMPAPIPPSEPRSRDELRAHYEIEKQLAARLRDAGREERRSLYTSLYDELFRRVPSHPQVVGRADPEAGRPLLDKQLRFLGPFLNSETVFLEVGAGDCALSLAIAPRVRQVYAVDVSNEMTSAVRPPSNFALVLSDGCSIPVPTGSITVAYSHQLMEHLHPDDALEQLHAIHTALAPGGVYLCITPSRLSGPHDISRYFDDTASGFHLREYTAGELRHLFESTGFSHLRLRVGGGAAFVPLPLGPVVILERLLAATPVRLRQRLAGAQPLRMLLGVKLAATKSDDRAGDRA
jgi:SAM-dependent methyltransferase